MRSYSILSLPITLASLIGSSMIGFLSLALVLANALVPGLVLPYSYYQALNFPVLAVLLPAVGIIVLMPIALSLAFKPETPASASITEDPPITTEETLKERFLEAA